MFTPLHTESLNTPTGIENKPSTYFFEAVRISGELSVSDETTELGYFSPEQMKSMDVMELFHERVNDAFARQGAAFLR